MRHSLVSVFGLISLIFAARADASDCLNRFREAASGHISGVSDDFVKGLLGTDVRDGGNTARAVNELEDNSKYVVKEINRVPINETEIADLLKHLEGLDKVERARLPLTDGIRDAKTLIAKRKAAVGE